MGLPKLILFALVALAGWYFYRRFIADATKLAKAAEAKRKEDKNGAIGTLIKDPVTGEYRVRRPEEG